MNEDNQELNNEQASAPSAELAQEETGIEQENREKETREESMDNVAVTSTMKIRDERGRVLKGVCINPKGRGKMSPEQRETKKALKEYINDYINGLTESLPLIQPALIKRARNGDINAIRELNDRVLGKAPQKTDITSDNKPIPLLHILRAPEEDTAI